MDHAEEREEVRLARDLLAGRDQAFDRFVDLFRGKIFQYSYLMCGQREDAEEIAQETLLKVFESFGKLREPERVRAWVFRIAKNACLTRRRHSVFAPKEEISLDELKPGRKIEIADFSALPEEAAWRGEVRTMLTGAVRALPEMYRAVLLLRDVEGLTTEEAAEVLDTSLEVVKTRLHRARLMVRKDLEQRYGRTEADVPGNLRLSV